MKIKNKMALNAVTILILMAVIGASAVIGIQFIQKNIFYLTQKSTPYQIKTFNHQRALQAHASNLLKVAASDSLEEFRQNAAKSAESLAEEVKAAEELVKLGSGGDYQDDIFRSNTKSIQEITEKRLVMQRDTVAAVSAMRNNLADASRRLQNLDAGIRKLQKGSSDKMLSNITVNANGSNQSIYITAARDNLKDVSLCTSRIMSVSDKDAVEGMYDKNVVVMNSLANNIKMIQWSESRADVDFGKRIYEMGDRLAEAKEEYLKFLGSGDASARSNAAKAVKTVEGDITWLLSHVNEESAQSAITQESSSAVMMASVAASSDTNIILVLSSELILSNAVIDSQINYSLSIRNLADFDKTAVAIRNEFGRIDATAIKLKDTLQKGKFKTEARLLADSLGALGTVRKGFLGKEGVAEKMRASLKNIEEVASLNQTMKEMVAKQMELSSKDVASAQQLQEGTVASVRGAVRTTTVLIIVIAVVAVMASILLSRWISSSITRPIGELSNMAEGFGSGNFSIRMDASRKDEFGTLAGHFNQATTKLAEITRLLQESIAKLSAGSKNLNDTAEDLYTGAREQVTQVEQSSVAMTEISATIEAMARNAHSASEASHEAHTMASNGKDVVVRTVRGMGQISDSVIAAAATIGKLKESSERIDSILNTINEIADATNLLALNAAIEAARAGEHGLGFAVVADEVRKLAQHTAGATHEIAEIIHDIQADTGKSVAAMNIGKASVEEGMKLAGEASEALDSIVSVSFRGAGMAQMIATATNDQATASSEVSQSMEKIAHITGTLKGSTMAIKDASGQLSGIAGELSRMASWFKAY